MTVYRIGDVVQSTMDKKITGTVVGYGEIIWPYDVDLQGDTNGIPVKVLLVKVSEGSSSLGPACRVLRLDRVRKTGVSNGYIGWLKGMTKTSNSELRKCIRLSVVKPIRKMAYGLLIGRKRER